MAAPVISALPRFTKTKSDLKKIRAAGDIPAVMYGQSLPPRSLIVSGTDFRARARGHRMIELIIEGQQIPVVVQDIMWHPVDRNILHIELHAVAMNERTHAQVPILIHGLESVEKHGGIVQMQVREAAVEGLPSSIPDSLTVDVSQLSLGDMIRLRDLSLPTGVTLHSDGEEVILAIVAPKLQTIEESAAAPGETQ